MITGNKMQRWLCENLGKRASITTIDGERCVRYDGGNKFDVEVSGTHKTNPYAKVNLYLWYDARICIKYIFKVPYANVRKTINKFQMLVDEIVSKGPIDEATLSTM